MLDTNDYVILNNQDINFITIGSQNGIITNNAQIIITQTGIYQIIFYCCTLESPALFCLTINGLTSNGLTFGCNTIIGAGGQIIGNIMFSFTAGDILTVRNVTGSTINLDSNLNSKQSTNISIFQIA